MSIEMANQFKQSVTDSIGKMGSNVGGFAYFIAPEDANGIGQTAFLGANPDHAEDILCAMAARAYVSYRTRTGATPEQAWEVLKGIVMRQIVANRF